MQEEISFGVWLRKQRRALDLTRQAFADQAGCAEVTLRRIEAGTLKPSKELASIFLEKLGLPKSEWSRWISFARGFSGFPSKSLSSSNKPKSNLPAPITTFIGREKEQSEVIRLFNKHRLVTFTGPGGVGKTRLSIKVAEQALENYPDGVWLVEFAPILDPQLIPRTTAIAVGLRDEAQRPVIDMLSDYLREKRMLIILDNCEHLLDACAQLADTLLKNCPSLKIFATSRESLGILGEAIYQVPSLELPDIEQLLEKFRDYESVRLFEERAQLVRMEFSLTLENAPRVAKICAHLDGIPLALELAAARVGIFSVEQIEERLQETFGLLALGNRTALPRHQTLRATIDWSYDLLSPAEQALFRRLSVFANGWTLEAAKSIGSDANIKAEKLLDLLSQLINKSLVIKSETQNKTRYRMLETIRQYANEKLLECGESDVLRDRHLKYFLNLAETAEPHLIRPEQVEWLPLLDAEHENLRRAFDWSLSTDMPAPALRFCAALGWFWEIRCYWLEGLDWCTKALAKDPQGKNHSEKVPRTRALYMRAMLEWHLHNWSQILAPAEESLALAVELSHKRDIAIAKYFLAGALFASGQDHQLAGSLLEQSFAELGKLNEPFWQARVFLTLGYFLSTPAKPNYPYLLSRGLELALQAGERLTLAGALGEYADWLYRINQVDEAEKHAEESEKLYKEIGSENTSLNSFLFAELAWSKGDYQKAKAIYLEMEQRFYMLGHESFKASCIRQLGILAMEEGEPNRAQVYLEEALAFRRAVGSKPGIALLLAELAILFYLQGNLNEFKQNIQETFSLKDDLSNYHKAVLLMIILGSLYFQRPGSSARIMGAVHHFEREAEFPDFPLKPLEKRYWDRAETHARKMIGDVAFESALAEGEKMTLDGGLELALKTVEKM